MRASGRYNLGIRGERCDDDLVLVLEKVGLWQLLEARGGLSADLDLQTLSSGQSQLFHLARVTLR